MENELFADVILPLPLANHYTYRVPVAFQLKIKIGIRVIVQFGARKFFSALVYRLHQNAPSGEFEIKDIDAILDEEPIIDHKQLQLWEWIAGYYCCTMGEVFRAALPSGLKLESHTKISLNPETNLPENLSDKENAVILLLEGRKTATVQELNKFLGKQSSLPVLKLLIEKNAVIVEEQLHPSYKPRLITYVRLNPTLNSEEKLNETLDSLKNARKQEQLLKILLSETIHGDSGLSEFPKKELLALADAPDSALKGLEEKNILEIFTRKIGRIERLENIDLRIKSLPLHKKPHWTILIANLKPNQPSCSTG